MTEVTIRLINGPKRTIICPCSDMNGIKDFMRKFYPVSCWILRRNEI